jgi:hypothetical protein
LSWRQDHDKQNSCLKELDGYQNYN